MKDEIVDEVRRIRDEHTALFDFDIHKIAQDIRRREEASGRQYTSLPPKPVRPRVIPRAG